LEQHAASDEGHTAYNALDCCVAAVQGVAGQKLKQLSERTARLEQSLIVRGSICIICCNLTTDVSGFSVPTVFHIPLSNMTGAVSNSSTRIIKSEALK
jgi:hypothetical protein